MQKQLYGRDDELKFLQERADWLAGKSGDDGVEVAVLYGPAGIGKTTLLCKLYESVHAEFAGRKTKPRHGYRYSPLLTDTAAANGLSGALNPAIHPESTGGDAPERAGFYWFGVRFDDPAYRQYRPFCLADAFRANPTVISALTDQQAKDDAASALRKYAEKVALDAVRDVVSIVLPVVGPLATAVYKAGKEIAGFNQKKQSISESAVVDPAQKNEKLQESFCCAMTALSFDAPLVIVIDNAHWSYDGAGDRRDFDTISKFLDGIRKGEEQPLLDRDLSALLKGKKPNRVLLVLTIDSLEYGKYRFLENKHDHPLNDLLGPDGSQLKDIKVSHLNERDSVRLFSAAAGFKQTTDLLQSLPPHLWSAVQEARGLPLRLHEMASLYREGQSLDGPFEAALLHARRCREFVKTLSDAERNILYCMAALASGGARLTREIILAGLGQGQDSSVLERALGLFEESGFVSQAGSREQPLWAFHQLEYPHHILGEERQAHCFSAVARLRLHFDAELLADADMAPICVLHMESASPEDFVAVCSMINDTYRKKFLPSSGSILRQSSSADWAFWARSVAEVVAYQDSWGMSDRASDTWLRNVGAIVEVVDSVSSADNFKSVPLAWSDTEISEWQCNAWLQLLSMAHVTVDPRPREMVFEGRYELQVPVGNKYAQLSYCMRLVDALLGARPVEAGAKDSFRSETRRCYVTQWLRSIERNKREIEQEKNNLSAVYFGEVLNGKSALHGETFYEKAMFYCSKHSEEVSWSEIRTRIESMDSDF